MITYLLTVIGIGYFMTGCAKKPTMPQANA
ncbi:hypothetical protein CPAV1605_396 [seawater metagenome]|uniref:Uncharacterized protein n=1 Tax=seawater metagenome TaxID=1561972 RepID=A0A5E8CHG7_9ZZZZ